MHNNMCKCVCLEESERQREERTTSKGFLVSCEIRILSFCVGGGAEYHFKGFCIKKKMFSCACTHTQIYASAPDVESILFQ